MRGIFIISICGYSLGCLMGEPGIREMFFQTTVIAAIGVFLGTKDL